MLHQLGLVHLKLLLRFDCMKGLHHLRVFLLEAIHLLEVGVPVLHERALLLLNLLQLLLGPLSLRLRFH